MKELALTISAALLAIAWLSALIALPLILTKEEIRKREERRKKC